MDEVRIIEVKQDILADNKKVAEDIRRNLAGEKAFMVNLMASPGSGKTSLILSTIEALRNELTIGVIEADIDSKVDSDKIAAQGIKAVQLRTGGFCHVDATMVQKGLDTLDLSQYDLLIIENVGNLVCPAEVDTGAMMNAVILSVPEGDDKPLKYPVIFASVEVMVVSKIDYLSLSDFNMDAVKERVKALNPKIQIFEVSSKTGEGIEPWAKWLKEKVKAFKQEELS
ncbi:MAG: hydrogenase nickel incorporation protein HypB [Proteobacteria bacterium]|nr:hydrogenase nickel incorporation protein HypB [Pseudomonadota bacterium]